MIWLAIVALHIKIIPSAFGQHESTAFKLYWERAVNGSPCRVDLFLCSFVIQLYVCTVTFSARNKISNISDASYVYLSICQYTDILCEKQDKLCSWLIIYLSLRLHKLIFSARDKIRYIADYVSFIWQVSHATLPLYLPLSAEWLKFIFIPLMERALYHRQLVTSKSYQICCSMIQKSAVQYRTVLVHWRHYKL